MHKSNQSRRKLVDQKAIALDRVEQEILHVARCAEMLRSMFTMQGIGKGKGGGKRHLSKLMPISDQPDQRFSSRTRAFPDHAMVRWCQYGLRFLPHGKRYSPLRELTIRT